MAKKPSPEEDLARLAEIAWAAAPAACKSEHKCRAYHRMWPTIRLMMKGSVSPSGKENFHRHLHKLDDGPTRKILVSGGADAGLLAIAAQGADCFRRRPKFLFVDRCETACLVNTRYAEAAGLDFEVRKCSILDLREEAVDAILSHSFLNFFPPDERPALMSVWFRALAPGGLVLTSTTINGAYPSASGRMTEEEMTLLLEELEGAALAEGIDLPHRQEMREEANSFWGVVRTYERLTEAELISLCGASGLSVVDVVKTPRRKGEGPRDRPVAQGDRIRMFVAARKPG